MLTVERLRELLKYDPETGIFTRKVANSRRVKVGDEAGTLSTSGYVQIRIGYQRYSAHRLAWFYMTGDWPDQNIDHINCIRDDNRFANLREATFAENSGNASKRSDNSSGFKGVFFNKRTGAWMAAIQVRGKKQHLGYFGSAASAHAAYCVAAVRAHGVFARPA